jgi:hypothetical protein
MPTDRPNAAELLQAVQQHLTDNVAPLLTGQPAFHLRVATNALAIVERTLEHGGVMDAAELEGLKTLLNTKGDLDSLNRMLAGQIRDGSLDLNQAQLLAHLRQTSEDKLALANPRYNVERSG